MSETTLNTNFEDVKSQVKTSLDLDILKYCQDEKTKTLEKRTKWISSPFASLLLSTFFALLGTAFGVWLQGQANMKLERQKFEADLILKMIATDDQDKSVLNLKFLINTGLIEDDLLKIRLEKIIKNKKNVPALGVAEIKNIQKENNLPQDGILGPVTRMKLDEAAAKK
jgi:hypothetical protein